MRRFISKHNEMQKIIAPNLLNLLAEFKCDSFEPVRFFELILQNCYHVECPLAANKIIFVSNAWKAPVCPEMRHRSAGSRVVVVNLTMNQCHLGYLSSSNGKIQYPLGSREPTPFGCSLYKVGQSRYLKTNLKPL